MNENKILNILNENSDSVLFSLCNKANKVRKKFCSDQIHVRGIIEFSNYCVRNCNYCGLRRDNKNLYRYRMTIDQIFENTKLAHKMGIKTIVLQSGEDPYYTVDKLAFLLKKIKSELQMAITLSIGEKTFKEYEILKRAGADRYLLKFETSDRELYKLIKPDSDFSGRFKCLEYLKELGYQVGSGNIIGLPRQTPEILLKDILTFDKLNLDMIGIGPFIPHPNTPFGNENPGSVVETLKVLALTRIVTKNSHLPATTALATLDPMGREKALCAGANVLMPNVGLQSYKRYYQIYPNKISIFESSEEVFLRVQKMLKMLRRKVSKTYGDSLKI